jgi:putative chitinase
MTPLQNLQTKIGVEPDNSFGPATLKAMRDYYKLSNERIAHFCGQVAQETGGFLLYSENLNYSASGLQTIFKPYFPNNLAEQYARQPIKIASRVYGNRLGNGNETSQEGWKYRGRGALQTTGKTNYQLLANHLNKPEIMTNPDLVATEYAFESALFYFDSNHLWRIADKGVNPDTILLMTKAVNGGTNGLDGRTSLTNRYYSWLK